MTVLFLLIHIGQKGMHNELVYSSCIAFLAVVAVTMGFVHERIHAWFFRRRLCRQGRVISPSAAFQRAARGLGIIVENNGGIPIKWWFIDLSDPDGFLDTSDVKFYLACHHDPPLSCMNGNDLFSAVVTSGTLTWKSLEEKGVIIYPLARHDEVALSLYDGRHTLAADGFDENK